MKPRQARLQVLYNKVDISTDLKKFLKSWSFTDNMSGQADDLQIELEDREHLWLNDWMPDKGATLEAGVVFKNRKIEGTIEKLPFGVFEIDEIENKDPPSVVTVKGISVPNTSSLRGEPKNRAWEETNLSVVAKDIATKAGLKFFYDTDDNPGYDRVEQTEETDLAFLMRLCKNAGLCLKVTDKKLIIFDERKYEQKPPVSAIRKGEAYIKNFRGRTSLNGIYKSCRVEYHDASKNQTIKYTFTPPNPPNTSRVLVVNERVSSVKEAEILAKKKLRDTNKEETTCTFSLMGDTKFLAGFTVRVVGYGVYDGKYVITRVTHKQRDGFETKLELRKCLEGY